MDEPRAGGPCAWTISLGPYVMGLLDERERIATRAHIDGCGRCADDVRLLSPVARQLDAVDATRLRRLDDEPWNPPDRLRTAVLRTVGELSARRRMRVAAAAALVVLLAGAGGGVFASTRHHPTAGERLRLEAGPGVRGLPVRGWVNVGTRPSGTAVEFHTLGLPGGRLYRLWFEDQDGERVPIGSFTSRGGTWTVCEATAGLGRAQLAAVGASDEAGATVLRAEFPAARST